MSSQTNNGDERKIPLHRRELHRLEPGSAVYVVYQSNRGKKARKEKSGEITLVKPLSETTTCVRFYDSDAERQIEVTLRETLEESKVRSQKTDSWSTIGTPVLVVATGDSQSPDQLEQDYLMGKRNGDFDSVVAAAEIKEFEGPVAWMLAVNQNG